MEAHADVAGLRELRLGRVDAYAHPNGDAVRPRLAGMAALHVDSGGDGVLRSRERYEERFPLGVDLLSTVAAHGVTDELVMSPEDAPVAGAETLEQPRRALDIGEEERHRPCWELLPAHRGNRGTARVL